MLYGLRTAIAVGDPLSHIKGKLFEVLCGSSVLGAPIQMIAEIPTQGLPCIYRSFPQMMRLCLYLNRTQGGFSFAPLRNKMGFSIWSVFYTFLRWLWPRGAWAPKNGLTRFTARCFATFLALRPNQLKKRFSISFRACFTPFALAQSTLCLCTKNGITHFTTECFAEQFPCSALGFRNSTPPLFLLFTCSSNAELSVSYRGGYSRSLWLACLPRLAVFDGGSTQNPMCTTSERRFH